MSAGGWFLAACALAALVCVAIGLAAVARAAGTLKRHAAAVPPDLLERAQAAKDAVERLARALVLAESILPSAREATRRIGRAVGLLRLAFTLTR